MTDTEREQLLNATRDAFQREQDALLAAATAQYETRNAKIVAVIAIAGLWLAIACIAYTLIRGTP